MAANPEEMFDDGEDHSLLDEAANNREAHATIFTGVTISDLSRLFNQERDKIRQKIVGVRPVGKSARGAPTYHIGDVAPYLVRASMDIEQYIKKMRPRDMPQALQKPFWDAQNGRLKFMQDAGHLWHTVKVQQVIAGLFKTVRQRIVLFADTVERQTSLSDEQRKIVQAMGDGLLDDIHRAVIESFKDYKPEGDRDEIIENGPPRAEYVEDQEEEDLFGGL